MQYFSLLYFMCKKAYLVKSLRKIKIYVLANAKCQLFLDNE